MASAALLTQPRLASLLFCGHSLQWHAGRGGVARPVIEDDLDRRRAGGTRLRHFRREALFPAVENAVGRVDHGCTRSIVQHEFGAFQQRKRIAATDGNQPPALTAGDDRRGEDGGGAVNQQVVRLKGVTQTLDGGTRRLLADGQPREIKPLRQSPCFELHEVIGCADGQVGPGVAVLRRRLKL